MFLALALGAGFFWNALAADQVGAALQQAHAHNDYEHQRPLLDALAQGFTSVEADIYLTNGVLLVGHDPEDLKPGRTLTALYLDPLKKFAQGKRSIFETGDSLTLLIDLKTEAEATYRALKEVLLKYAEILTTFENGQIKTRAVTIILSGNRPRETLLGEKERFAAFDGRMEDLGKPGLKVSFMPLVSDSWRTHFKWTGAGAFPEAERIKLNSLVKKAHEEGRRIRFWATPDKPAAWLELRAAGVDLINTDDLAGLAEFLRK